VEIILIFLFLLVKEKKPKKTNSGAKKNKPGSYGLVFRARDFSGAPVKALLTVCWLRRRPEEATANLQTVEKTSRAKRKARWPLASKQNKKSQWTGAQKNKNTNDLFL